MRVGKGLAVFALAASALAVAPKPISAQAIEGAWRTEVPISVSNVNGVERVDETRTAHMTITREGETLRAVWQLEPGADGATPQPRTLAGTFRDGHVVLTDTARAYVRNNMDEDQREILMIQTYELHVDGDTLRGHVQGRSDDGMVTTQRREFMAVRS